jgi:hypothetical protein
MALATLPLGKEQPVNKEKVKPSLCLIKVQLHHSASITWGKVINLTPGSFAPRERAPVTTGKEAGWAPETVQTLKSREKSILLPGIDPRPSSPYPVAIPKLS